jgi:hypothetical protein
MAYPYVNTGVIPAFTPGTNARRPFFGRPRLLSARFTGLPPASGGSRVNAADTAGCGGTGGPGAAQPGVNAGITPVLT